MTDAARKQAGELADRLLDDLFAGRLEKIGLGEVERYAVASYIAAVGPRPEFRELVNWTIAALVRKAARRRGPRSAIFGTNEQAE